MGHPRAIEAVVRLPNLVLPHPRERDLVRLRILAARDERGHAADGVGSPTMARPHEQVRICPHEGDRHRHLGPIRQDELFPIPELLDDAEDVVPPARVKARGVVPEFVQNLLHLEGRRNRLDEGGGLHGADRDPEGFLREPEHLVPEASLQMALHLRQVEVRAGPASPKLLRVVEKVEPEVHQAPRDRYAIDDHVLLWQMPTAGPNQKGRSLPVQAVFLPFGTRELQGPPHRIEQVQLALNDVPPRGRVRVLEIGHEHLGARVQGIDHHLPIGRPGDLDPSIVQVRGKRSDLPRPLTDGGGLRKEVEHVAAIDPNLALSAAMQEILTRPIEVSMQVHEERDGLAGEDRAVPSDHRCADLRAFDGWSLHAVSARPTSVRLRALSSFRTARVSHASAFEGLFWPRRRPSRRTGECRLNLLRKRRPWGDHGTHGAKTYCPRGTWSRHGGGTGGKDDDDARDVRDSLSRATAGFDLAAPRPRDRRLPAWRTASPSMRRQCVGHRKLSGTPRLRAQDPLRGSFRRGTHPAPGRREGRRGDDRVLVGAERTRRLPDPMAARGGPHHLGPGGWDGPSRASRAVSLRAAPLEPTTCRAARTTQLVVAPLPAEAHGKAGACPTGRLRGRLL